MKILLVNPPNWVEGRKPLGQVNLSTIPLGLGYIAAVLEKSQFSVSILDMSVSDMTCEELEKKLAVTKPDIVGITSMTCSFKNALKVAKSIKHWNPSSLVVMGGVHATFMHEEILRAYPEVDMVVRYEGELTMKEAVEAIDKGKKLDGVKGLTYRDKDKIISNPLRVPIENLDELPYPAHHLLQPSVEEYIGSYGVRNFPMITTRGCPFGCIYCSTMAFHGQKYRTRSIQNILDELAYLIKKYKVNNISFVDDNFTMQNSRVQNLCQEIKNRKLSIEWGCSARVDQVSEDLLRTMKEAGCNDIFFGIESASQRVLNMVHKRFSIRQAKDAVKKAEKLGIRTHCSFIIGLPGESAKSLKGMIDFIDETRPTGRVLPNVLEVLPGTELMANRQEYFGVYPSLSGANITKAQVELLLKFYAYNYGVKELFRVSPPEITIQ